MKKKEIDTNWTEKNNLTKTDQSRKRVKRRKKSKAVPNLTKERQDLLSYLSQWIELGESLETGITEYSTSLSDKEDDVSFKTIVELKAHLKETNEKNNDFSKKVKQNGKKINISIARPPGATIPPQPKARKRLETLIFYIFLLLMIMILGSAFSTQNETGSPKNIGGFVPMTVLTRSMQSVYPQNSFVLAKVTDPKELTIGDDITYIKENNTTVTHRIVGINENYLGTRKRGFETKGVENARKDEEIVRSDNVLGKIVFSNVLIGESLLFIRTNMILTAVTLIAFIIFSDLLIKYIKNRKR